MATALFISRTDLVKNSIIDGNTDTDLFIQYVKIAQEIHIQSALGSKLYNKISEDIASGNLTGNYLALVTDFVQPMLIHYAMVDFLPFCAYQVKSGGIYKHSSENSETVNKDEVDFLVQKERNFAEHYTRRFVDYMCFNSTKFPEYLSNTDSDIRPDKDSNSSTWVL
tara:strand:- start:1345 stop:1845 length:501 start_codon:yes stop_codon:yes gene_type:complete